MIGNDSIAMAIRDDCIHIFFSTAVAQFSPPPLAQLRHLRLISSSMVWFLAWMVSSLDRAISLTSMTTMSLPTPATTVGLDIFLLLGWGGEVGCVEVFLFDEDPFFVFFVWLDGSTSVPVYDELKSGKRHERQGRLCMHQ